VNRPASVALKLIVLAVTAVACGGPVVDRSPGVASADPSVSPERASPSATPVQLQSAAPLGTANPSPPSTPNPIAQRFPGGLLIADRLNNRLVVVNDAGTILWRFPVEGSLPAGQTFSADDAFVTADGKSIVANEESNQIVVRIDIASETIVWQYGTYGVKGSGPNEVSTPDDAYPMANGDVTIADIKNCRILEVTPSGQIVRQWGTTGQCTDNPPTSFAQPNGDTPLPDGGILVTDIKGSRVVRLSATGALMYDLAVPVHYPSDAHLLANGDVLVADYSNPGAVVVVDPSTGATVYRYGPSSGPGELNRPSLVLPLSDGTFALNDDYNHRVVVIDPKMNSIVWSYGHDGQPSAADGYLNLPDGIDVAPVGTFP